MDGCKAELGTVVGVINSLETLSYSRVMVDRVR